MSRVLVTVQLLLAATVFAAEPEPRPRIGLCLAGGGARGGAHIGVLQVLEELRIPVDYIAGTSIGSIVGGLYATGMTPAEMEEAVDAIDWFTLFDDAPPRQTISFRRKEEDFLPAFGLELGFGSGGLKMPAGFVAGPKLIYLLRSLTLPVVGIDDFDELPIPYRAAASSIDDGSLVVLDHGSLADAMRASMAIPGAFTPHVIDGQTLVDGGMLRNTPYDIVKAMGADIVIVVDVGPTLDDLDDNPSLTSILGQTIIMTIAANGMESLKQLTEDDILLVPDLDGIGVESFDLMADATARGLVVADENRELLSKLSVSEAAYASWRSDVVAKMNSAAVQIADVRIESPGRVDPRRVQMRINSQADAPLDLDVLEKDLARIYRIGEFEQVDYSLQPSATPLKRDLVIKTKDKRWGPNYLRIGLSLVGHLDGESRFTVLINQRTASINRLGAEWRNLLSLGDRLGLDTEFYQPLSLNGRYFVVPGVSGQIGKSQQWLTPNFSTRVSSRQWQGQADVGVNLSHWGEFRIGAYHGGYAGAGENDSLDVDDVTGGWRARLVYDQLDNVSFPLHGWALYLEGRLSRESLGADTEYERLGAWFRGATTTGRTTFTLRLEGGTSFQTSLPYYDRFELGGFTRLSGIEQGRIHGDEMALLTAGFRVRVARLNSAIGGDLHFGMSGELGQAWLHESDTTAADLVPGATVYFGAETLLGPFYLGYGLAEQGQDSLYFMLGRPL